VHTRIVIPHSSVDYEQPQILRCDGRIFLVTLYVCPSSEGAGAPVAAPTTAAGVADEAPAAGAADGFSHQLVIHEFTARTLEFPRVSREPFTYISRKSTESFPSVWELSKAKSVVDLVRELSHTTICARRSGPSTLSLKETRTKRRSVMVGFATNPVSLPECTGEEQLLLQT
jgi:hypothetical protein